MVLHFLAQMVQMVSNVGAAETALVSLTTNSKSFRYRHGEVVSYWKTAAESSFGSDSPLLVKFKTLRWVPADSDMEAQRSYRVVVGKTGAYAAARTKWDYSLL